MALPEGILGMKKPTTKSGVGEAPPEEMLAQMGISPEESRMIEQYIANGMKVIHSEKTRDRIVEIMESGKPPVEALASATDTVMKILDSHAAEGGTANPPPDMVRFIAGYALMNQIAEIAHTAGVAEITPQIVMEAFSHTLGEEMKRGIEQGKYTPEELKQAGEKASQETGIDPRQGLAQIMSRG